MADSGHQPSPERCYKCGWPIVWVVTPPGRLARRAYWRHAETVPLCESSRAMLKARNERHKATPI